MGQGGNVWEWNETVIGSNRGLRGGAFVDGGGALRADNRIYFAPTHENSDIGFRVASIIVPEPASALLLVLPLLGLTARRRR